MARKRRGEDKRRNALPHGLNPKTFPVSVREFVEIDYIHKLGPEERAWLARFNDRYHGASYPKAEQAGETPAETDSRRAAYIRKNKANNDVYAVARAIGLAVSEVRPAFSYETSDLVDRLPTDVDQDWGEEPRYLESAEYREALARVRALLPVNPRNKVRNTPELRAAYAALERAKKGRK